MFMSVISYVANSFLNDPSRHSTLATIKGLRQGIVYGAKVRFAHSLVQAFLFRHEPWPQRIRFIIRMTYLHGKNRVKIRNPLRENKRAFRMQSSK